MWKNIGRYGSERGAITAAKTRRNKTYQLSRVIPATLIIGHRPIWYVESYIPSSR
jgi:hypothetical protein